MDRIVAFRKALTTWAEWVDSYVDETRTRFIYQGITTSNYNGTEWGEPDIKNSAKETEPISDPTYSVGLPKAAYVVKEVVSSITKPVYLQDITALSQLRKDAHPSSYNAFKGMDCTHWCIARVPDT